MVSVLVFSCQQQLLFASRSLVRFLQTQVHYSLAHILDSLGLLDSLCLLSELVGEVAFLLCPLSFGILLVPDSRVVFEILLVSDSQLVFEILLVSESQLAFEVLLVSDSQLVFEILLLSDSHLFLFAVTEVSSLRLVASSCIYFLLSASPHLLD